ncbi:hypothetical protein MOSE0_K06348 [Monosporozyma servazzii]
MRDHASLCRSCQSRSKRALLGANRESVAAAVRVLCSAQCMGVCVSCNNAWIKYTYVKVASV